MLVAARTCIREGQTLDAKKKYITFYNLLPTREEFDNVDIGQFYEIRERLRNERPKRKPDMSILEDQFQRLSPPPAR